MPTNNFDSATTAGAVPSPCIGVCVMDLHSKLCTGCLRTLDEIALWSSAGEPAKRAIWIEIKRRAEKHF